MHDHRLVVHVFAPGVGPDAELAARHHAELWRRLHDRLGLTEPVPEQPVGVDPSDGVDRMASGALAVCRHPTIAGREAMWVREHEVDCVSVCLVPDSADPGVGWTGMTQEIADLLTGIDLQPMMGLAIVRSALTDLPPSVDSTDLPTQIERSLPPSMAERLSPAWWKSTMELGDAALWRLSQPDGGADDQIDNLVILAESSHDDQLGALVWATTEPSLAPLTRYLLYTASLRFHARIREGTADIRRLRTEAHETLDRLSALLVDPDREPTDDDLDHAWRDLGRLQATRAGLIDVLANLRAMRRTVSITLTNIESLVGHVHVAVPGSPPMASTLVGEDLALGAWLGSNSTTTKRTLMQRADAPPTSTQWWCVSWTDVLGSRLSVPNNAQERLTARSEQLALTSAAIITALLTCLTTIQAIGYRLPISSPLELPVIAASTAAVFFLSTLAVRLRCEAPEYCDTSRRQQWPQRRCGWG